MELVRIYLKLFNKIAITTNFLAFFLCFFHKHCPPGSGSTERKINADQDDDPDLQTTWNDQILKLKAVLNILQSMPAWATWPSGSRCGRTDSSPSKRWLNRRRTRRSTPATPTFTRPPTWSWVPTSCPSRRWVGRHLAYSTIIIHKESPRVFLCEQQSCSHMHVLVSSFSAGGITYFGSLFQSIVSPCSTCPCTSLGELCTLYS